MNNKASFRDFVKANMCDGDEEGLLTMSTNHFLNEIAVLYDEYQNSKSLHEPVYYSAD